MNRILNRLKSFNQKGQSNIEYILIVGIVLIALIFVITQYGDALMNLFRSKTETVAKTDYIADTGDEETVAATPAPGKKKDTLSKAPQIAKPIDLPEPPSFFSQWLPYILLFLVFCLMIAIIITKIKQRKMLSKLKELDEGGQAMTETALSLPVVLFFVFTIMQLGLLYHARFMVHLASFYAARSAIVWVPIDSGAGKNKLKVSRSDPKMSKILSSARYPCIPIAAPFTSLLEGLDYTGFPDTGITMLDNWVDQMGASVMTGFISNFNSIMHNMLDSLNVSTGNIFVNLVQKYLYAYTMTSVEVMQEGTLTPVAIGKTAIFSDNGPITVRVSFYYKLDMPLINAFLGKKIFPVSIANLGIGDIFKGGNILPVAIKGWYFKIRATTTLDNEGFSGID